jgi:hypothetical protein
MGKVSTDTFWADSPPALPVERRVLFPSLGRLTVSIQPGQPVPDASMMTEQMIEATVVEPVMLKHKAIAPQLVFGTAHRSRHDDVLVVLTPDGRELPVLQTGAERTNADPMDYEQLMQDAAGAMPPAQIAEGDSAIGFLFRTDVIHFFPLAATTLPEEVESFHDGSATSSDVIPLLPFQS